MLTEEQIAEFETKHGDVKHVIGKDKKWEIVFKTPLRKDFKAFKARAGNESQKAEAQEIMLRQCVIFPPTLTEFDALLDKFPGISENEDVSRGIKELCGMVSEVSGK